MSTIDVKVPAIGGFKDVGVIDVLVKPGDEVQVDASLVTLESDKATMDVPSPAAGKVRDVKLKVGDRVSEGSAILTLDEAEAGGDGARAPAKAPPRRRCASWRATSASTSRRCRAPGPATASSART